MEIIEVPSYLATEKVEIAMRHLIPKQLEKHGLNKSMLSIPAPIVADVISGYTREAGVRQLERCIASICRKAACDLASGAKRIRMTKAKLQEYLGVPKYLDGEIEKDPAVGLVNGLAWTSVGGSTMQIEAEALPGSGQIQLTGKLGDVMQESAKAAITCIRAHADKLGVTVSLYQSNHEGDLVDAIQQAYGKADGIVINPAAYTHTSVALLDALKAVAIPAVEVHISDPDTRESFRHTSYVRAACVKTIAGHGTDGYLEAMDFLAGGTGV